jgi:enoyl-[acyl-carrier protein] reductase II
LVVATFLIPYLLRAMTPDKPTNQLTALLHIKYPIIQAGMVWCSGWKLASACSNAGILGVIGSGSMHPAVLEAHLQKCVNATSAPFGVNLPLLYPEIGAHIASIIKQKVPVVITSAGNPALYTQQLKDAGIVVLHVISSAKFAEKAERAGVDGIICEGFEAGGHNGREETTTMCLVPAVRQATALPLAAAGGIASGRSMLAAMALGADGVQVGSRFVASEESSAHLAFKQAIIAAGEGDTLLTLKEITPVRLLKNSFFEQVMQAYARNASADELKVLLGKGRAKAGMFEGDMEAGELEIGQVAASITRVMSAAKIVDEFLKDYNEALAEKKPL